MRPTARYPRFAFAGLALAGPTLARPLASQSFAEARRVAGPVVVDGSLDDTAWRAAPLVTLPYEVFPGDNSTAPVTTRCRFVYDRDALYLGCEADEPDPERLRARHSRRDDLDDQDRVGLMLDPFGDRRRAWMFVVNPLGQQLDATYDQQQDRTDLTWDAIWRSAARVGPGGFVVELALPFKSLRFPRSSAPRDWGMILFRHRPRTVDTQLRSERLSRADGCVLCQAGALRGIAGVDPGRNAELAPTITSLRTDTGGATEGRMVGRFTTEVGLEGRWSLSPGVVLNGAINPDFSQVEADAIQLDANNRFAINYPERRPFFLEGADLFSTSRQVVVSRAIADPDAGLKVTGKAGSNAFGALVVRDAVTNLLLPGPTGSRIRVLDQPNWTGIARYRRDLFRSSSLGAIATARHGEGYSNDLAGLDATLRPHPAVVVSAQWFHTRTRYPDTLAAALGRPAGPFQGSVAGAEVTLGTRRWYAHAYRWSYGGLARADAGFIGQVGIRETGFVADRWLWGGGRRWLTRVGIGPGVYLTHADTAGGYTNAWRFVRLTYEGPAQLRYQLYLRQRREHFLGTRYDFFTPWMMLGIRPSAALGLTAQATLGDAIDYGNGRQAGIVNGSATVTVRAGRRLEVAQGAALLTLRPPDGAPGPTTTARAVETRALYHFGSRAFLRAIAQYREVETTGAGGDGGQASRDRILAAQLLLSYRLDPLTAALIGFGEGFRGEPTAAGAGGLALDRRSFFLKLSYGWRP